MKMIILSPYFSMIACLGIFRESAEGGDRDERTKEGR
jgi:hypothetical protein